MKLSVLSGFVLLSAASAVAQTPSPNPGAAPSGHPQSITLTGCVSSGNNAEPFTLSNPVVLPGNPPGASGTAAAQPAPMPPPAAVPPGAVPTPATPPAAAAVPPETPVGTAGTAAASGTSTPPTGAATSAGAAAPSGMNGYRLSGTDMTSWAGQRVQMVGTVVPAAPGTATPGAATPGAAPMPEFRVQSVQPISGPCPK